MQTIRELITQAYRVSGVLSSGMTPTGDQMQVALFELNGMIDIFRNDELWPTFFKHYDFNCVGGQMEYTIGVQGTNPTPPDIPVVQNVVDIISAQVQIGGAWIVLKKVTEADIFGSNRPVNVSMPPSTFAFSRPQDPYDRFILFTPSSGSWAVKLTCNGSIQNYGIDDDINLPSGFAPTLQYGLASILCDINGLDNPRIERTYNERLALLRTANSKPPLICTTQGNAMYSIGVDAVLYSGGQA